MLKAESSTNDHSCRNSYTSFCLLLIGAVLLQGGENVDITAAFGGTSQAAFGPRGSVTLLAKITWVLAALFIVTRSPSPSMPRAGAAVRCWKRCRPKLRRRCRRREEVEERTVSSQFSVVGKNLFGPQQRFVVDWALKTDDRRAYNCLYVRKWRNWQTHQLEGLTLARAWGFESPLPHQTIYFQ